MHALQELANVDWEAWDELQLQWREMAQHVGTVVAVPNGPAQFVDDVDDTKVAQRQRVSHGRETRGWEQLRGLLVFFLSTIVCSCSMKDRRVVGRVCGWHRIAVAVRCVLRCVL